MLENLALRQQLALFPFLGVRGDLRYLRTLNGDIVLVASGDPNLSVSGSMVIAAEGGKSFAANGLSLDRGLLTSVPVIPEKSPRIPD